MPRLALLLLLTGFAAAAYKAAQFPPPSPLLATAPPQTSSKVARFESRFASNRLYTQVHAASLIELQDGRLRAFWFSGSREGARDVAIHSAVFDPVQCLWSPETPIVTRKQTQAALQRYIAKLGNPVPVRAADGALELYYVTVSLGGWAGSSITRIRSRDEGASWGPAERLITSPFLNLSTLVKGAPVHHADGTLALPVYHEFISKFSELLRIDRQGRIIDKQRLTPGGLGTLQPVVGVGDANHAVVLMRDASETHRILRVTSEDGGLHWSAPQPTALANPDAALTVLALADGRLLAVANAQEHGRDSLSLLVSSDRGQHWREVRRLEDEGSSATDAPRYAQRLARLLPASDGSTAQRLDDYLNSTQNTLCKDGRCRYEFSYPYLIQARNGDFHLLYTWNRTFIKHLHFTPAWLKEQLDDIAH